MTVGPPVQIILVPFDAGSPKEARRVKPIYPAKAARQHWPPHQAIPRYVPPAGLIENIKRQSQALLEQARSQRAAHG
jgi:hypothetical protein